MSRFDAVLESETNRSKALRGEVVLVTNERLEEMQEQAVRDEGVGYTNYHWHWAAIINELIAHRKSSPPKGVEEWHCPDCGMLISHAPGCSVPQKGAEVKCLHVTHIRWHPRREDCIDPLTREDFAQSSPQKGVDHE